MPLVAHFLNVGQGDCTIIQFPSGRVAMIDVHNLKCFDPTTKAEKLQRFHESLEYITYLSAEGRAAADQRFLAEEEAQLTDPLAFYDATIGPTRDIFRMIITHPDMDHMT